MGKVAPDRMIDGALLIASNSDRWTVCSGSPATYTDAVTTLFLAGSAVTPLSSGSQNAFYLIQDDVSGRKLTMSAQAGISITNSGSALAVCLVNTSGSNLNYVTTCTSQWLVSGGTVDIPSWKINIQDPT